MAKRRGFFEEIAYQNKQAKLRAERDAVARARAQARAEREQQRLRQQFLRAAKAAELAGIKEKARMEREAAKAHAEMRTAEVAAMNEQLTDTYAQIDGILAATLGVDDHIDLQTLKVTAEHPPFDPGETGQELPAVAPPNYPPEPMFVEPERPKLFGSRKKYEARVADAEAAHAQQLEVWTEYCRQRDAQYAEEVQQREAAEATRKEKLTELQAQYEKECLQRQQDADARNSELDQLISSLAFDVEDAINEYAGIVFAHSVYPDVFPVDHDHSFDLATRELTVTVAVPPPDHIPSVKEYKYVKAKDEVTESALSAKARKDRYSGAVWQVAVRTIHEIFEADRDGKIHTVSLTVGSDAIDPATGNVSQVPFVIEGVRWFV